MGQIVQALNVAFGALAAVVLVAVLLRKRRIAQEAGPVDRRTFLNRVMFGSLAIFAVALGGGSLALLWPEVRNGLGSRIVAGKLSDILADLKLTKRPIYNVTGQFYLIPYKTDDLDNIYVQAGVAVMGLMALSQRCSHLGCRVPYCQTSGLFECPCHSARFNLAGEWLCGPAPAGMWRFPIEVRPNGDVIVDTRRRALQPPRGIDTLHQSPSGDLCVPD